MAISKFFSIILVSIEKAKTYSSNYGLISIIAVTFTSFVYYIYLFDYAFSFNFSIGVDRVFLLYPATIAFFLLFLALTVVKSVKITLVDTIIVLILSFHSLKIIFLRETGDEFNEQKLNAFIICIIYLLLRFSDIQIIKSFLFPVLITFLFVELYLGLKDISHNFHADDLPLQIRGSLKNSGVYSIFLVGHIPLIIYYSKEHLKSNFWQLFFKITIIVCIILLISVAQSRAAIFALLFYAAVGWIKSDFFKARERSRKIYYPIIAVILGLALIALIEFRPSSVSGRLLILKIAMINWKTYLTEGVGYGNFYKVFPAWQISYFENLDIQHVNEYLNADEVYMAFNEPLQVLVENGIGGVILFSISLYFLIIKKTNIHDKIIFCAQGTLIILLATSIFYYTFHVNAVFL